jgi:hypothetical protein
MIGKIVGAVVGKRMADRVGGLRGPGGALLGVGAASVMRRMGPLGLIAAAAGGWALKRHFEKREANSARRNGQIAPGRP